VTTTSDYLCLFANQSEIIAVIPDHLGGPMASKLPAMFGLLGIG
jgi:hypothetical protein